MLPGLLCALIAALAYGSASILQSIGIRGAGSSGAGSGALSGLMSQPLYFIGLAMDGAGFVAVVIALQFLPLFLVQAVVASSVGVTAVIAAMTGTRLPRPGWMALAAAGVGLVLLSVSAASEGGSQLALGWRWALLGSAAPIGLLLLSGPKLRPRAASPVLAFGAGLGFTVVAIASRSLAFPHPVWKLLLDPGFWAILASGGIAVGLFALALAAGSVTTVSAITFTTETVVPAVVGLTWLGDTVRTGFWPVAAIGFLLAIGGAIALSRFAEGAPDEPADPPGPPSVEGRADRAFPPAELR